MVNTGRFRWILFLSASFIFLLQNFALTAQSRIPANSSNHLANSRKEDQEWHGDIDKTQVVFFEVPDTYTGPLYFCIYDPDNDVTTGPDEDTAPEDMSFYLYGGSGALTGTTKTINYASIAAAQTGGTQLDSFTVLSGDGTYDGQWANFNAVYPSDGEHIGNKYYFKVIVAMDRTGAADCKNGYQLDVSTVDPGTGSPTGLSDVRAFAYSWTVGLQEASNTWDLYPFVPDSADPSYSIMLYTWDFDTPDGIGVNGITGYTRSGNALTITNSPGGDNPVAGTPNLQTTPDAFTINTEETASSQYERAGTWHFVITETALFTGPEAGDPINLGEIWFTLDQNGLSDQADDRIADVQSELLRTYAYPYIPDLPDHTVMAAEDGTADLRASPDSEKITLTVVDSNGDTVPFARTVEINFDSANVRIDSSSDTTFVGPSADGAAVELTTDDEGYLDFTISGTAEETVTVSVIADGSGTTDRLPATGTLGTNETVEVLFAANIPTMVSAATTTFTEGNTQTLANILITATAASQITAADDIYIRIPDTLDAEFNSGAAPTLTPSVGGSVNSTATFIGSNIVKINVISDFANTDTLTISGLALTANNSASVGNLEMSISGQSGPYAIVDSFADPVITINAATVYQWEGDVSDIWTNTANWVGGAAPTLDDGTENIIIATVTGGNDPNFDATTPGWNANDLTVSTTSILDVETYTVDVSGTFQNNGTVRINSGSLTGLAAGTAVGDVEFYTASGSVQGDLVYSNLTIVSGTWNLSGSITVEGDLDIQAGSLTDGGNTITLYGNWNNSVGGVGFTSAGTVVFAGTDTVTISGNSIFNNFSCTVAGKSLLITGGSNQQINGALTLRGSSGNELILNSTDGSAWTFDNGAGADTLEYLWVDWGIATTASLNPLYSTDGGNNVNWNFGTSKVTTWDGDTSAVFATAANWDNGTPVAGDSVIIPAGAPNPAETGGATDLTGSDLQITSTGTLDISGDDLDLTGGTFQNDGTLIVDDVSTLTGFTVNTDSGTVQYSGATGETGLVAGNIYNNLTFSGTGTWVLNADLTVYGDLTLAAGVTLNTAGFTITVYGDWDDQGATLTTAPDVIIAGTGTSQILGGSTFGDFTCTTAGKTLAFEAGAPNQVDITGTFDVSGTSGNMVTIKSTTNGAAWTLNRTGTNKVSQYTAVRDCTATGATGNLSVSNGQNLTGNTGVDFTTEKIWTGGGDGTSWNDNANWSGGAAPSASDNVTIDNGVTITISAPAVANDLEVIGDITLNSTLTLDGVLTGLGNITGTGSLIFNANPYYITGNIDTGNIPLTINNNAVMQADAIIQTGTGALTFGGTVNGQYDLTLYSDNDITLTGIIGGSTPLASLTIDDDGGGGTNVEINANIDTQGNTIHIWLPVYLTNNVTVSDSDVGGGVYFHNTIDSIGGTPYNLTVNSTGAGSTIQFSGVVGGTNPIGNFTINSVGDIQLANDITTDNGTVDFQTALTLTGDIAIDTTDSGGSTGAAIGFTSNIDSNGTARDLSLTAGTGTLTLGGLVGNTSALDIFSIVSTSSVINRTGNNQVATFSAVTSGGAITFQNNRAAGLTIGTITPSSGTNVLITNNNGAVTVNGTINSDGGNITLTNNGSTMAINGTVDANGGALGINNTGGNVSFGAAGQLDADTGSVTISAGTFAITDAAADTNLDILADTVNVLTNTATGVIGTTGQSVEMQSSSGTLSLVLGDGSNSVGGSYIDVLTGGVDVTITNRWAATPFELQSAGNLQIVNSNTLDTGTFALTLTSTGGNITLDENIVSNSGSITLTAGGNLSDTANGSVSTTSGIVTVTVEGSISLDGTATDIPTLNIDDSDANYPDSLTFTQASGTTTALSFLNGERIAGATVITMDNGSVLNLATDADFNGSFSFSDGAADTGQFNDGGQNVSYAGNVILTGVDVPANFIISGTAIFDGTTQLTSNGTGFNIVQIGSASAGGSLQTIDDMDINGAFSVTNNGATAFTIDNTITVNIAGNMDLSNLDALNTTGSSVIFDGTTLLRSNTLSFNNVRVDTGSLTLQDTAVFTGNFDFANSGEFSDNGQQITVGGNIDFTNINTGTASFTGTLTSTATATGSETLTCNGVNLNNFTLNDSGSGGTIAMQDQLLVDGDLTITGGELDAGGFTITLLGDWSNSDIFTSGTGLVHFNADADQSLTSGGTGVGQDFYNVRKSGTAGTLSILTNDLSISNQLTIDANRVVDLAALNLVGGGTLVNSGVLDLEGNAGQTITFTNDTTSGIIRYTGAGATGLAFGDSYFTLQQTAGTFTLDNTLTCNGNFDIDAGTMQTGGNNITVQGNWDVEPAAAFTGTGTVQFSGTNVQTVDPGGVDANHDFTVFQVNKAGGSLTLSANIQTVDMDLDSDLADGGMTIYVSRNWDASGGGDLATPTGTVNFNTTTLGTLSGATSFNNFTCTAQGKTLQFTSGTTQTISGVLTVTGAAGVANHITLEGTAASPWTIDQQGTESINYAVITYGAVLSNDITADNSQDNGNNDVTTPGWIFTPRNVSWVGTTTAWNTGSNWSTGFIPNMTDNVTIANGATTYPATLDTARTVRTLTIENAASMDTGGNTLTVSQNVDNAFVNNGTLYRVGGDTVTLQALSVNDMADGGLVFYRTTGGNIQDYQATGSNDYNNLEINENGQSFSLTADIQAAGDITVTDGTLQSTTYDIDTATLNIATNGTLSISGSGVLTATGTTDVDGTLTNGTAGSGLDGAVTGAGTINAGSGGLTLGSTLVFSGNTNSQGGGIDVTGNITNTGTISVGAGGFIAQGAIANTGGTVNMVSTGNLRVDGNFTGGALNGNSTGGEDPVIIFRGTTVTLGTFDHQSDVIRFEAGNAQNFNSGGAGNILGPVVLQKTAGTTVSLSGNSVIQSAGAALTTTSGNLDLAGFSWRIGADLTIDDSCTLDVNNGTLTDNDAGYDVTVADGVFRADGTSTVNITDLTLNDAAADVDVGTGPFSAAVVSISDGNFTQTGDSTGNVQEVTSLSVSGGTVILGTGPLTFGGAFSQSLAGTIDFGAKTVTGITTFGITAPTGNTDLGTADITAEQDVTITDGTGTFDSATSRLRMAGANPSRNLTCDATNLALYNLNIESNCVLLSDIDVDNDLTINTAVNLDASGIANLYIGNDWTTTGTGTFDAPTTIIFNGGTANSDFETGGAANLINNLTVTNGTTLTMQNDPFEIDGTLLIDTATETFDANNVNFDIATIDNDGEFQLTGDSATQTTQIIGVYDTDSGTTLYDGTNGIVRLTSFFDLDMNDGGTIQLNNGISVYGDLTLTGGTFNANTQTVTIRGNNTKNTLIDCTDFYDLVIDKSTYAFTTATLGRNITARDLTINTGTTLDADNANNYDITLDRDWAVNGTGTFTARNGTVTFQNTGNISTIAGNTSFYDFTCITNGKTIEITGGSAQTISNALTLTGDGIADASIPALDFVTVTSTNTTAYTLLLSAGDQTVDGVDLSYCTIDDTGGDLYLDNSLNSGNNDDISTGAGSNFCRFTGKNVTWTGLGADDNWSTDANWDYGRPPNWTDNVVIANVNLPSTIDAAYLWEGVGNRGIQALTIDPNAVLYTAGRSLEVNGAFTNNGTLRRHGGDSINLFDATDMSGSGTVQYDTAGGDIQNYQATGNNDYYNLVIDGNTLTFTLTADLDIANDLTVTQGTLSAATFDTAVVRDLTVSDTLDANAQSISVGRDLIATGTLDAGGAAAITVYGNVDFSNAGDNFTQSTSTLTVRGLDTTIDATGEDGFYNITLNKTGAANTLTCLTDVTQDALGVLSFNQGILDLDTFTWILGADLLIDSGNSQLHTGTGTLDGNTIAGIDIEIDGDTLLHEENGTVTCDNFTITSGTYDANDGTGAGTLTLAGALLFDDGTAYFGAKTVTGITDFTVSDPTGDCDFGSASFTATGNVAIDDNDGSGTFNNGHTSTLTMNGGTVYCAAADHSLYNLIIAANSSLLSDIDVNNNLTINDTVNLDASAIANLYIGNDWTTTGTATFDEPTTIIFDGGTALSDFETGGVANNINNLTVTNSTTLTIQNDDIAVDGTLTIDTAADVLDLQAQSFTVNTLQNRGLIQLTGTQTTQSVTTPDTDSGTTEFYGTGGTVGTANWSDYYDLDISGTAAGSTFTVGTDIEIHRDLTVNQGILDGATFVITLHRNFDTSSGTGSFADSTSTVRFTDNSYESVISGNNTFYNLVCSYDAVAGLGLPADTSASGKIIRVTAGSTQTISTAGQLVLRGDDTTPAIAPLDGTYPPTTWLTLRSTDNATHWNINIETGATFDMIYLTVYWSDASYNPIAVPDYVLTYECIDWLIFIYVQNSYTEDSDHNGKIDRIRAEVFVDLNGDFSDFDVDVDGYTVTGYLMGDDMGSALPPPALATPWDTDTKKYFFILLEEKSYLDTGITPDWTITDTGNSLKDFSSNFRTVYHDVTDGTLPETPEDQAPPVIGYTLAVAEDTEIFVHFSEPVVQQGGGIVTGGDFTISTGQTVSTIDRITTSGNGTSEIILNLNGALSGADCIGGTVSVPNAATAFRDMAATPNDIWSNGTSPYADRSVHRITDVGLGPVGNGIVEPVWARDTIETSETSGVGIANSFDGSDWLQPGDISLQAHINTDIGSPAVELAYETLDDIDTTLINGNLWLPNYDEALDFSGLTPWPFAIDTSRELTSTSSPAAQLRQFDIPGTDAHISDGGTLQFFFYLPASDLYCGRVINPDSAEWYRSIAPWELPLHNIIEQKGSVTILNNIINPLEGDVVTVHYILDSRGPVLIQVFDLAGGLVEILFRGTQSSGEYTVTWDGTNRAGNPVARGIYFVRVTGPDGMDEMRKVLVEK